MPDDLLRTLPPAAREEQDVSLRFMLRLLAFIALVLLLMIGLAFWIFPGEVQDRRFAQPFPDYPGPRLQASPRADMQAFRAAELQHLNSVGWVDRQLGTVHIPIDQAMRDVAARGIPGWPAGDPHASQGDRR